MPNANQPAGDHDHDHDHDQAEGSGSHVIGIGYYLGSIITLFGVIIAAYGLFGPEPTGSRTAVANLNVWWGLILIIIGALALGLSTVKRDRAPKP